MSTSVVVSNQESNPSESDRFTPEEVNQFESDGYVIVRSFLAEDQRREMLRVTLEDLQAERGPLEFEADLNYPGAPESRSVEGGHTIRRLKQAHSRHFAFTEYLAQPALVNRLRQLLGSSIMMPLAHHNCIMTKQPQFSSATGWHQDVRYWSFERPELISVWAALGDEHPENGCLQLIPGTHRMQFDRDRLDDALFLRPELAANRALIENRIFATLEPGDLLFFHARTFHAAGRNETTQPKFSVVFTFRPGDNRPIPGTRSASLPELLLSAD